MDQFRLERVEEAFHRGIVVAVGSPAHPRSEAGGLHGLAVLGGSILNAAIGMMD